MPSPSERQKKIRNFSIIAHIDHGKSTLADRILEFSDSVAKRDMEDQLLDNMELERERGITIKARAVRIDYKAQDGTDYELNLIDTPGHVDFNYEVSRSLNACEGALLVVDATQGIQAQTLANAYLAIDAGLEIVPVINKIDLPSADVDRARSEIEDVIGIPAEGCPAVSAKTGLNISDVMDAIIRDVPPPTGDADAPLRALIFDSVYNSYLGVVIYIRVKEGTVRAGDRISLMATGAEFEATEVGMLDPFGGLKPLDMLSAGDVQLAHMGSSALNVFFADASGNPISSIRQGKQFYVRASGTPTEPITIMVKANTANAVTLDANRGRMFVCTDDTADVQPVGIGGIPHIQSASATLTLPTLNPPASPAQTGEPVTFKKTDAESGAVLQGAVIRIDNAAGERVWQGETGADGLAVTDVELEYDTDYTYYEVSAPTGYDLDNTHCTLRISRDGGNPAYWSVTNRLTVVENPPVLTDVTLKKADADTGAGLAGAKFKVMDASGAAIGVFVTGNDGTVTVKNLKPGSYQWSEQEAPVGYTLNKTVQSFTISDTGVVSGSTTISNEKIKPSVTLKKVDEQGKPLAGATIKVQDAAGKEVFNGKTDADGKVTVSGLALNTTYTYFEYSAPVGYELNSTKYTFTVDNAGNVSKPQDIVNKKTVTATPTCTPPVIVPAAPVLLPPKTGDMGSGGVIGVCLMVTAVCAWIVIWYRHWQNENRGDER